ncbi:hypothetical protein F4677DRAFT_451195 [Hypoxylon crocopeplum]|nr:hypothetical protein F4677DRAFT_451195 [Hypoxylon crocopeplum]
MTTTNSSTWAFLDAVGVSSPSILIFLAALAAFAYLASPSGARAGPKFMFNNHKFMVRAQRALRDSNIARFFLGPKTVYLVAGPQNIKAVFGRQLVHDVTNQEQMTLYALPALYKMNREEV